MGVVLKILGGIVLIAASVWWIVCGSAQFLGRSGIADLATVLNGAIPPLLVLLGAFIVWLEWDEWRIERELREEEKRRKRRKK